jgi:hypothetical protein
MKKKELRKGVSISLLPSEKAMLKAAAERANETSLSAFVKKVLLLALDDIDRTQGGGRGQ